MRNGLLAITLIHNTLQSHQQESKMEMCAFGLQWTSSWLQVQKNILLK
jgi:hypothetical protein